MSRWINTDRAFLPYVAAALGYIPTEHAQIVAEFDGTKPVAAAIFDSYNGNSIYSHLWIAPDRRASRMFWYAIYHYCWEQLGCKVAVTHVAASNKKAQKLDEHLGFVHKGTIENYYADGDGMMIYAMTPQSIPDWRKWKPVEFSIAA